MVIGQTHLLGQLSFHSGIDLVVRSKANPKICAVADGLVTMRTYNGKTSYGNGIEIMHTYENGTVLFTFYAHMKDDSITVNVGDRVVAGQVIGEMGRTRSSNRRSSSF